MPEIREEFEARYPLPEGMARNGDSYSGHKDWWLWGDRWETWQASRAALSESLELPPVEFARCYEEETLVYHAKSLDEALHQAGIEVKQP